MITRMNAVVCFAITIDRTENMLSHRLQNLVCFLTIFLNSHVVFAQEKLDRDNLPLFRDGGLISVNDYNPTYETAVNVRVSVHLVIAAKTEVSRIPRRGFKQLLAHGEEE